MSFPEVPGLAEARAHVAAIDAALLVGFARLGPAHRDALDALAVDLAATPLAGPVAAAVTAVRAGPPGLDHLVALAAAREALLGAAHDGLLASAGAALGRPVLLDPPAVTTTAPPAGQLARLQSAREWLMELALGGFALAEPGAVAPFADTLEHLQEEPALGRLTALLTGLYDEWMALLPVDSPDDVPLTRWADLWSRALLGCSGAVDVAESVTETGRFSAFAIELVHHDHAAAAVCWGVWEVAEAAHLCRVTLSAWRVPAIPVEEALLAAHGPALRAFADGLSWGGTGARASSGDLRLLGGGAGPAAEPMEVAKRAVALPLPARPAVDRHPVQLAIPVCVEQKLGPTVTLGGVELPVRFDRCGVAQGITADSGAERWVGLLRWDAGAWSVQPLGGVSGGKKPARLGPHAVLQAGAKAKSDVLATLRERAGRLLRKKS